MAKYLISTTNTYRVATVEEALALRSELQKSDWGTLTSFTYSLKEIKSKNEIVEEYVIAKAKMDFNNAKEPEFDVDVYYGESDKSVGSDF